MRILLSVFFPLLAYSSSCQSNSEVNIYDKIKNQLRDCLAASPEKDSEQRKTKCYELVLKTNYEELRNYGVDTVKNKDFKSYYDLYLKRFKNDDSFVGSLVKQERLPDDQYSITLRSSETKIEKQFLSAEPINEKQLKKLNAGPESIVISYQTIYQGDKELYKVKSIVYLGTK